MGSLGNVGVVVDAGIVSGAAGEDNGLVAVEGD